jgi:pimeloyl-ACP methyl ester carboxylesterase
LRLSRIRLIVRISAFDPARGELSMLKVLKFLALLIVPGLAYGRADYAREQRWADEIAPAILVGDALRLEAGGRKFMAIYATAPKARAGVVLVHGLGMHPDWGITNVLRSQLADHGYTTLSVQMPVLAAGSNAEQYPPLFPEASQRLAAAVQFLRAKGHGKVAIVAHSLGARMANHYIDNSGDATIDAWVAIGILGSYVGAERLRKPVLDLYGERDFPAVLKAAPERAQAIRNARGSAQIEVPAADHFFAGQEDALVRNVRLFLDQRLK